MKARSSFFVYTTRHQPLFERPNAQALACFTLNAYEARRSANAKRSKPSGDENRASLPKTKCDCRRATRRAAQLAPNLQIASSTRRRASRVLFRATTRSKFDRRQEARASSSRRLRVARRRGGHLLGDYRARIKMRSPPHRVAP